MGIGHHHQEEAPGATLEWIAGRTESSIREPMLVSADVPFG